MGRVAKRIPPELEAQVDRMVERWRRGEDIAESLYLFKVSHGEAVGWSNLAKPFKRNPSYLQMVARKWAQENGKKWPISQAPYTGPKPGEVSVEELTPEKVEAGTDFSLAALFEKEPQEDKTQPQAEPLPKLGWKDVAAVMARAAWAEYERRGQAPDWPVINTALAALPRGISLRWPDYKASGKILL